MRFADANKSNDGGNGGNGTGGKSDAMTLVAVAPVTEVAGIQMNWFSGVHMAHRDLAKGTKKMVVVVDGSQVARLLDCQEEEACPEGKWWS